VKYFFDMEIHLGRGFLKNSLKLSSYTGTRKIQTTAGNFLKLINTTG